MLGGAKSTGSHLWNCSFLHIWKSPDTILTCGNTSLSIWSLQNRQEVNDLRAQNVQSYTFPPALRTDLLLKTVDAASWSPWAILGCKSLRTEMIKPAYASWMYVSCTQTRLSSRQTARTHKKGSVIANWVPACEGGQLTRVKTTVSFGYFETMAEFHK